MTARRRFTNAITPVGVDTPPALISFPALRVRCPARGAIPSLLKVTEFAEVHKVASLLRDLPCPWFVCGGWALDLFLGRVTRPHEDVDVAVARDDQLVVREYLLRRGWALEKAMDGKLIPWLDGERLELPAHAVWCRKSGHDPDFFEVLLNEIDCDGFRFRRDQSITRAQERMSFRSPSGLPLFAPEVVLLYQSNRPEKYDADFRNTAQSLSTESRDWLKGGLKKLFARHPWVDSL